MLLLREEVSASLHTPHSSVGRTHCVRRSTVTEPFSHFYVSSLINNNKNGTDLIILLWEVNKLPVKVISKKVVAQ